MGSWVAQRSKALHLSTRGISTDPGLIPGCITTGCKIIGLRFLDHRLLLQTTLSYHAVLWHIIVAKVSNKCNVVEILSDMQYLNLLGGGRVFLLWGGLCLKKNHAQGRVVCFTLLYIHPFCRFYYIIYSFLVTCTLGVGKQVQGVYLITKWT